MAKAAKLGRPAGPARERDTELGRLLARARFRRSEQEVAAAVGVTRSTYHRWETGRNVPAIADLARLSAVLRVSAARLFRAAGGG